MREISYGTGERSRCFNRIADVVKLVDTPDLGSGAERYAGSSPSIRTSLGLCIQRRPFLFNINTIDK